MERSIRISSLMLVISLSISIAAVGQPSARAQPLNRVGLVIDFGNGVTTTRCVEFSEPEITGYEVLRRSGLRFVADEGGMGVAICDIGQTSGCPASDCFCECQGTTCEYWSYLHMVDGSWRYSPLGASGHTVRDGDVEGWAWGAGGSGNGAQPPVIAFDQLCASTSSPGPTAPPPTATDAPPTPKDQPAAPSAESSPTPQPATPKMAWRSPTSTSSPSPSPSAQPAAASPSSTPTLAGSPSASPSPTPTAQPAGVTAPSDDGVLPGPNEQRPVSSGDGVSRVPLPTGYIVFGLVLAGLLGWLFFFGGKQK
jgi:hypothetical protein